MAAQKDFPLNIAYQSLGPDTGPVVLWAHGWGQNRGAFLPLAQSLERLGKHILVDFPGFGESPAPAETWGTQDYADALARFIRENIGRKVIWVGHSFGCRVGLQIAARHPDIVFGLFLMAAAGLPKKMPFHKKLYFKARVALFKTIKKLIPLGVNAEWLYKTFGSADYRNAGPMRAIMVKTVNENLSAVARQVACPVQLVYGTCDTETPLDMGKRYNALIPNSELAALDGLDHYTILSEGRHQVAAMLRRFMEKYGNG